MTHDRPSLDGLPAPIMMAALRYVVERRKDAEENLFHAQRHFDEFQEKNYRLADAGIYTGTWLSLQSDRDHYTGQVDVLRCMESELMYYIGKIQD